MSARDNIRKATLGKSVEFRNEVVEWNGEKIELRQPSIKVRGELFKKCTFEGELQMSEFLVWSTIYSAYIPGTNDRVFEDTDFDVLVNMPTGSFVDEFADKIASLMNVKRDVEDNVKN